MGTSFKQEKIERKIADSITIKVGQGIMKIPRKTAEAPIAENFADKRKKDREALLTQTKN